MKKSKKHIVLSILLSGMLATTSNASLWDNSSIFSNMTETNIATDPKSGGTYMSGGAIEVRFKRSGSFPPIFTVGAPSLKASCRGITFDAGYAMFMNLERLGQQLSQAGTSVAYGVLIGLVYSMPGVEQAFTKLNEWSQWLQTFLSDSCSIGTNWGKSVGKDLWKDTEGITNDINNGIPSPEEYINKSPNFKSFMTTIYANGTNDQKSELNAKMSGKIFANTKGGIIATYINSLYKKGLEPALKFDENNVVNIVKLDDSGLTVSSVMMCYYLSQITQNIAIDESALKKYTDLQTSANADKLSAFIEEMGDDKSAKNIQARNNSSSEAVINFMLNGTTETELKFSGLKVALVNIDDKKGTQEKFAVLTDTTEGDSSVFNNFEGFIGESKKLVYKVYNKNITDLFPDDASSGTANITTPKVNSAYPMMYELVRSINLYHSSKEKLDPKVATGNTSIKNLLDFIAYQNAIALANVAIDNISHAVEINTTEVTNKIKKAAIANPESSSSLNYEIQFQQIEKEKKIVTDKINELRKALYETSDKIAKDKNFTDLNDKMNQIIRERNVRGNK